MSSSTVAVVGASSNPAKFGNKSVRAHLQQGYQVYPVNPRADKIEGLQCYPALSAIPLSELPEGRLNRITVYLPPQLVLPTLDEIASIPHDELWLNPGTESPEVLARAEQLGLSPIQACSIVDLGVHPSDV